MVMLTVMIGLPPALALSVDVPLPDQVRGMPFDVRLVVGAVRVTERFGLSTSLIAKVPLATSALLTSVGEPVVSGKPLTRPSSETVAVRFTAANTGPSLVPVTVMVMVAGALVAPSLSVAV
ncbi:hypothetical protein FQZ97_809410 [compost metagenome]